MHVGQVDDSPIGRLDDAVADSTHQFKTDRVRHDPPLALALPYRYSSSHVSMIERTPHLLVDRAPPDPDMGMRVLQIRVQCNRPKFEELYSLHRAIEERHGEEGDVRDSCLVLDLFSNAPASKGNN